MAARVEAVVFDIIETCFSLEPLRGALAGAGLPEETLGVWFSSSLRDGFAMAATDSFAPFRDILGFNLEETARRHGVALGEEARDGVLAHFARLPPHADTVKAYRALADAGVRIIALSNGAAAGTRALLEGAGIAALVETVLSVEGIKAFKPRKEVYRFAAREAGLKPESMAMIATHAWDVHGAARAGLQGGFVARGQAYPAWMAQPAFIGETLLEVAQYFAASGD